SVFAPRSTPATLHGTVSFRKGLPSGSYPPVICVMRVVDTFLMRKGSEPASALRTKSAPKVQIHSRSTRTEQSKVDRIEGDFMDTLCGLRFRIGRSKHGQSGFLTAVPQPCRRICG